MSSPPPVSSPSRPSAVVNEDIRRLWMDPRVRLSAEGRQRYEQLVTEWAAAVEAERSRSDVVKAA